MSWYLTVNYLYPSLQLCHPTLYEACVFVYWCYARNVLEKNYHTSSNVKSQSKIKSACFCCLITQLQCNVQLWFSHQVQKACNCEQVPTVLSMTTWKNSPASKGLVLLINTPAYCELQICLECMIQEFVHKKLLALTAVYLITEETTEFQALEDQNLICSLVAWFLTIGYIVAARQCYYQVWIWIAQE